MAGLAAIAAALLATSLEASAGADLVAKGQMALSRGDGVAAEIAFRQALAAGAKREDLTAAMGEAYLVQGQLAKAREWLGAGQFPRDEAPRGLRMLSRLEMLQGNPAAAEAALDQALRLAPRDGEAWMDRAELRYRTGRQFDAVAVVDKALTIDPGNVRALDFKGLLVRDQFGAVAALPWFEAAIYRSPRNGRFLAHYAAALGDAGQAAQMLTVTRRMIELGSESDRAFWIQGVLAARGGDISLAQAMLNRAKKVPRVPAVLLLDAALNIEAGNPMIAVDSLERLLARQPNNSIATQLLARALYDAGRQKELVARLSAQARLGDASPYLQTLVGRALEDLGERGEAAVLLDQAARVRAPGLTKLTGAAGQPGSDYAKALRSGDQSFVDAAFAPALVAYGHAARIRFDDPLLTRMVLAQSARGDRLGAANVAAGYLSTRPQSMVAARIAADYAASVGDWPRARLLLAHLGRNGGDLRVLADLAYAQARSGDGAGAATSAARALALQPMSPIAAQALLIARGGKANTPATRVLAAKARWKP